MSTGESRTCTFLLAPEGFIIATMKEGATFDLEDARESVAVTWQVAGETRRPVLVDTRGVRAQSKEARQYFMSPEAERRVCAVALLVGSPVSRVIANFFLRMGEPSIPTQVFSDFDAARAWVLERVP